MTLRAPEDRNAILDRRLAWNDDTGSAVLLSLVQTLALKAQQRAAPTARPASARAARRAPSPPRFSPRRPRSARPASASASAAVARPEPPRPRSPGFRGRRRTARPRRSVMDAGVNTSAYDRVNTEKEHIKLLRIVATREPVDTFEYVPGLKVFDPSASRLRTAGKGRSAPDSATYGYNKAGMKEVARARIDALVQKSLDYEAERAAGDRLAADRIAALAAVQPADPTKFVVPVPDETHLA